MVSGLVSGKLALVTGGGSGIGRAACQVLAREGATVIAADRNFEAALETIKKHAALASGTNVTGDHSAVELDVSDSKSVQNLLQTILTNYKTPPRIIVNSAGITRDNWLLKLSEEDYDSVLDVNLKGTFLIMQTFAKAMTDASVAGSIINISSIVGKYGNILVVGTFLIMQTFAKAMTDASVAGSIINISSIVGKYGNMGQTNYSASKAGVVAMTQSAAKELGKFNVRVNAILPGFVNTPIISTVPEKVKNSLMKLIPLGRLGEPSEVAEVITFLSSEKSSFITGAAIDVTGGY